MTNEELVQQIRAGARNLLPELWEQVERFVAVQANKRLLLSGGLGGVEFEDLYNSGYIAMVIAADSFDPDAGCSFIGWLALTLKTAFAEAGGYRSRKQARDPLHRADSLDAPLSDDPDSGTLAGLLPDPTAESAFEDTESQIFREQLRAALDRALAALPEQQRDALQRKYYGGQTLNQTAAAAGVYPETVRQWQRKGLQALHRRRELRRFVEERTPYYLRVGVGEFQRTGESAVERLVFRRERLAELGAERSKQ